MDFKPNISPVEVIKKGAFGGTYFRDILVLLVNSIKIVGKNLKIYKVLTKNTIVLIFMMLV